MAAGDVSISLLADLRLRLRDPDPGDTYSDTLIYEALRDTQLELGNMLPVNLLSEFITTLESVGTLTKAEGLSSVTLSLSVLKSYEQGIIDAYYVTGEKWMRKIMDLGALNNGLSTPSLTDPGWRVSGAKFYAYPNTIFGVDKVKIAYLTIPAAISASVDPVLNVGLHYLLLLGAEYRTRNSLNDRDNLTLQVKEDYYTQIGALTQQET